MMDAKDNFNSVVADRRVARSLAVGMPLRHANAEAEAFYADDALKS